MNRIYKVVWNAARSCYVVGSEFIHSNHTEGGCRKGEAGGTLKRAVLSALLAGTVLLPLSGAQVSAFDWSFDGGKHDLEEKVDQIKTDMSDLKDAFKNSAEKDHKQDAAIDHNYDIDKMQGHEIDDLKEDMTESDLRDTAQDGRLDGMADWNEKQDAAIEMGKQWDEKQNSQIGELQDDMNREQQMNWNQQGEINDLKGDMAVNKVHDAMQDAALAGNTIHDVMQDVDSAHQWGHIGALEQENNKQQAQIDEGIRQDHAQWGAINGNYAIDGIQQGQINDLKGDMVVNNFHDAMQDVDSAHQWGHIGALEQENNKQQAQIDEGIRQDHAQWGAINGNYAIDGIQQGQINDLKGDMAANNFHDAMQDAALAGNTIHDVMQDVDSAHQWGHIGALEQENEKQQAQIDKGIEQDHAQWGAIKGNYAIDGFQQSQINDLNKENDRQWDVINGGVVHDAIQDGAIIGGIIKDVEQDDRLDAVEDKNTEQDGRLDVVEEVNQDQQGQIDEVRGEVGTEHAERVEADKELQSQIDEHDGRLDVVEEVNQDQQGQIDEVRGEVGTEHAERVEADKELQSQIDEHDGRLDVVEEVNKDQQSQIDEVRGEVGTEQAERVEADKNLQTNIDTVDDKVGDLNYSSHDYVEAGDSATEAIGKLDDALGEVEYKAQQHTTVSTTDNNIKLESSTNTNGGTDYQISLNPDLKVDSVTAGGVTINKDDSGTVNGLMNTTWDNTNYVSGQAATEDQLHQAIQTNVGDRNYTSNHYVEDGQTATDAISSLDQNLAATAGQVNANTSAISGLNSRVDTLDGRIDKVGANAAALAALHPLDFDPDDKWDFAAGVGNYGGENAMAVGAFYRPNEDTMFSVGGSFGTGENMVNAGVSFKIGRGNHISTSRVAMAKEIETLRHNVAQLTELVNKLVGSQDQIQNAMTTPFPDVPENHWAYETIEQMRERGIVEGYPDGTFGGDRQMTRYEFATIVYRALQKGLGMNEELQRLVDEFRPELELIRVDTIAQDSEGHPTIERVRVNKA